MALAPSWPGKIIWIAAMLSLAVHILVLSLASGLFDHPEPARISRLVAVLVPVSVPAAGEAPAEKSPAARPPTPRRPRLVPAPPPVILSDPQPGDPLQIIQRPGKQPGEEHAPPSAIAAQDDSLVPAIADATAPAESVVPDPATKTPAWLPPRRIRLLYDLRSSLIDGQATYLWQADLANRRYVITGSMEANGFFATMFAGRLSQESTGEITDTGLRPTKFSLRRGEAQPETANFDWSKSRIDHLRNRGEHVQPLVHNAQDLQSFIFQFAYEFRRVPQPERITFAITNARRMESYEFRVAGRERLQLPIGDLGTIHLVRNAPDPGGAYEAWLSPSHHYLPVKIRFMLNGRFQVEQLVTRMDIEP